MSANPRSQPIEIEPLITYPKKAEAGKSYVMTVDLRQRGAGAEWPYEDEEYIIHFMLDSMPLFNSEPVGDASIVLHRFGGTYGPAIFILTANQEEMTGTLRLTLVNEWGMPVDVIEIPGVEVTAQEQQSRPSPVWFAKESAAAMGTAAAARETGEAPLPASPTSADAGPPGFRLRHTLNVRGGHVAGRLAWSPDGSVLVVPASNIQLWDAETGRLLQTLRPDAGDNDLVGTTLYSPSGELLAFDDGDRLIEIWETKTWTRLGVLEGHERWISSLAWSPDGRTLASTSIDGTVRIWDAGTRRLLQSLRGQQSWQLSAAWSPDGQVLASGSSDSTVRVWDASTGEVLRVLEGHAGSVYSLAWSPDGQTLASGGGDCAIFAWDAKTGGSKLIINNHQHNVIRLSFSADNRLLASKSSDGEVMLWRCDTWAMLAKLDEHSVGAWASSPAFHPAQPTIATLDEQHKVVRIWDLDLDVLLAAAPAQATPGAGMYRYSTAKVVLLGDSGVGKSGLAHVLVGDSFTRTDSTHGRHVWLFDSQFSTASDDRPAQRRDIFLWDLAGQNYYRLLHKLQLTDVAMALIVFDARHEDDSFSSVRHWERALRQSQAASGQSGSPIRKILVAARADIGGSYGRERIQALMDELEFDGFFETSAKTGEGVEALAEAIRNSVDWDTIPTTITSEVFYYTRDFLISQKQQGHLMATVHELYRAFLSSREPVGQAGDLRPQFEVSLGYSEAHGLVRRMNAGDYVLLQPEIMDSYAASIIDAVVSNPQGLGSIREADVLEGRFTMPQDERINDKEQERAVLSETVDLLVGNEIALRSGAAKDALLVFPSLVRLENPQLLDPEGREVVFTFEGLVQNIYTTLVVSLTRSGSFTHQGMWRNVSTYVASRGGTCGILLRAINEGRGELTLFFDQADAEAKSQFAEFVHAHLRQHAVPDSVTRHPIIICSNCRTTMSREAVERRVERGFDWIACNVCDEQISLRGYEGLHTGKGVRYEYPAVDPPDKSGLKETDWKLILNVIRTEQCTPLIGSGMSSGVLPLSADIVRRWAGQHGYPFDDPGNLMHVAQYLAIEMEDVLYPKELLADRLRGIKPDLSDPASPYRVLAELPLPLYITTNYDDLMSQALRQSGKVVQAGLPLWRKSLRRRNRKSGYDEKQRPTAAMPLVFHLCGSIEEPESMVLTEDDHLDFAYNVAKYEDVLPMSVLIALSRSFLLLTGVQPDDWAFRVLLGSLRYYTERGSRNYGGLIQMPLPAFYESPATRERVATYWEKYFAQMGMRVYWGTSEQFWVELKERWAP